MSASIGSRVLASQLAELLMKTEYGAGQMQKVSEMLKGFDGDIKKVLEMVLVDVLEIYKKTFKGKRPSRKELEAKVKTLLELFPTEWAEVREQAESLFKTPSRPKK